MDDFKKGTVHPTALVSSRATLGAHVTVGPFTIIHAGVLIGDRSVVGSHCILGEPTSDFYLDGSAEIPQPCVIGEDALIRSHTIIYQGVVAGHGLETGHRVTIREGSTIGNGVRIGTMSDLQGDLTIGDYVRLHSSVHIGRLSTIEDLVWVFPFVVLTNDPHPPSDTCTVGPTIRRCAVIATNSILMPGVVIGEHALVGAMSLVNRDVAASTVVVGVPAKPVGLTSAVTCKHGVLDHVYPWTDHFRRGYPPEAFEGSDSPK